MAKASCLRRAQSAWIGTIAPTQQSLHALSSLEDRRLLCTTTSSEAKTMKYFLHHTFYKGKSALSFQPKEPIIRRRESGAFALEKEGWLCMTFAPSTGPQRYDWNRKQCIALSPVELGGIISLTTSEKVEYFHDPHKGSSNEGMVGKCLKVEGMPDKSGFFFNLSVLDKLVGIDERFSVPLTKGDFAVLKSLSNFIIPYLMGWHSLVNPLSIVQDDPIKANFKPE